jgi:hypothetical protein
MKYCQSTLIPGEKIVYQAHISLWSMGPRITIGVLNTGLRGHVCARRETGSG